MTYRIYYYTIIIIILYYHNYNIIIQDIHLEVTKFVSIP